ncbi:uncharacterized protein LOC141587719 [Silene latifolia]|uniref:uncharacterized protein LOC141587719 n=1 Tax=Silene latifolia TaxID=37657 RepID=UPI003D7755B0
MARGRGRPPKGRPPNDSSSLSESSGAISMPNSDVSETLEETQLSSPRQPILLNTLIVEVVNSAGILSPSAPPTADDGNSVISPTITLNSAVLLNSGIPSSPEHPSISTVTPEIPAEKLKDTTMASKSSDVAKPKNQLVGSYCISVVQYFRKGWFSFRFANEEDMNNVLKEGPWKMGSYSLILKQWHPSFSFEMEKVSVVPIWVLFPGLDPYLWSSAVLSKMSSKIGRPMFADIPTTNKDKLSFARVMIEVDISSDPPLEISLNTPFGPYTQRVEYEWIPHYCASCGKMGHLKQTCKKNKPAVIATQKKVGAKYIKKTTPCVLGDTSGSDGVISISEPTEQSSGSHAQAADSGSNSLNAEMHQECTKMDQLAQPQIALKRGYSIESPVITVIQNSFDPLTLEEGEIVSDIVTTKSMVDHEVATPCVLGGTSAPAVEGPDFVPPDGEQSCHLNKHYNGRIWVLWNPATTKVDILQEEAQVIHCKIRHYLTGKEFYLSVVYGSNSATRRHDLWDSLNQFSTSVTQWASMGDFNVVRHSHEKISATPPILSELMDFNSCLLNCGLDDMSGTGNDFTWFNKQEVFTRVYSKLDRILVNNTWLQTFSQTTAHFLDPGISDHCPGLLTFHDNDRPRKHFKFLNYWTEHPQFLQLVDEAWTHSPNGNSMFRLMSKLKAVKKVLRHLHSEHYANIGEKIKTKKEELSQCFRKLRQDPINDLLINQEKELSKELWALKDTELQMLSQRAKVAPIDPGVLSNGPCVSNDGHEALLTPVTRAEIKKALFDIDSNKSPGMDGFSAGFFKKAWEIVGNDFCLAVEDFFKTGFLPKQANTTLVSLIPNKAFPQTGRSLFENVMLTQGLLKGYGRKNLTPRCMLKIDISKAFDTLQWSFIRNMLAGLNFPPIFIKWIMACVTGSWFTLKVNCTHHGFFKGQSGVRQGDPLSPYLFVLSMEILSRELRTMCLSSDVSYHPRCSKLKLTHLVFADDLMIFTRGDLPSVQKATAILSSFSHWSGLTANLEKSTFILGCAPYSQGSYSGKSWD